MGRQLNPDDHFVWRTEAQGESQTVDSGTPLRRAPSPCIPWPCAAIATNPFWNGPQSASLASPSATPARTKRWRRARRRPLGKLAASGFTPHRWRAQPGRLCGAAAAHHNGAVRRGPPAPRAPLGAPRALIGAGWGSTVHRSAGHRALAHGSGGRRFGLQDVGATPNAARTRAMGRG
jgi:hypothetical protein